MNILDIILLAVLAVIVFFALRKTLSKRGSCSCGSCDGNCACCGTKDICKAKKEK